MAIHPYAYGARKSSDVVMNLKCATKNGLQHCENAVNVAVRVCFRIIILLESMVCADSQNISGRITHVRHHSPKLE